MAQIIKNDDYLTPEELIKAKYVNTVNTGLNAGMSKYGIGIGALTNPLINANGIGVIPEKPKTSQDIMNDSGFTALQNAMNNTPKVEEKKAPVNVVSDTTQTSAAQTPQVDVQSYIQQMAEAKKKQGMADKLNVYNTNLAGLNAQKEGLAPKYYNERNNRSVQTQMQARNFAEYMANRGLTNSGTNAQAELVRNLGLQGNIGALNRQQITDENNIETQKNNLGIAYNNDIASLNAGIDADTMGRLIDQYNSDRSRNDSLDQFAKQYGLSLAGLTGKIGDQDTLASKNQQFNQSMDIAKFNWDTDLINNPQNASVIQSMSQNQAKFDEWKAQAPQRSEQLKLDIKNAKTAADVAILESKIKNNELIASNMDLKNKSTLDKLQVDKFKNDMKIANEELKIKKGELAVSQKNAETSRMNATDKESSKKPKVISSVVSAAYADYLNSKDQATWIKENIKHMTDPELKEFMSIINKTPDDSSNY